jgi:hypothetical protein
VAEVLTSPKSDARGAMRLFAFSRGYLTLESGFLLPLVARNAAEFLRVPGDAVDQLRARWLGLVRPLGSEPLLERL